MLKNKRKIENTKFYSKKIGTLARGCRQCVKGEKLVMFVTGLCPRRCNYCPVSDQKYHHDVTFANEWPTEKLSDIIEEAKLCGSKGAGFTGGDPLVKINRTCTYIKALKREFGNSFHIHLYTSFNLITKLRLEQLHEAGLDEIRFHADLDIDETRLRIITSAYVVSELADYIKESGLKPAIVTEYPTWDALIVELDWL